MGETDEECKVESRREVRHTSAWTMDGMTRTNTLSQCHVRHYHVCGQTRENVTCEGCSVHTSTCLQRPDTLHPAGTAQSRRAKHFLLQELCLRIDDTLLKDTHLFFNCSWCCILAASSMASWSLDGSTGWSKGGVSSTFRNLSTSAGPKTSQQSKRMHQRDLGGSERWDRVRRGEEPCVLYPGEGKVEDEAAENQHLHQELGPWSQEKGSNPDILVVGEFSHPQKHGPYQEDRAPTQEEAPPRSAGRVRVQGPAQGHVLVGRHHEHGRGTTGLSTPTAQGGGQANTDQNRIPNTVVAQEYIHFQYLQHGHYLEVFSRHEQYTPEVNPSFATHLDKATATCNVAKHSSEREVTVFSTSECPHLKNPKTPSFFHKNLHFLCFRGIELCLSIIVLWACQGKGTVRIRLVQQLIISAAAGRRFAQASRSTRKGKTSQARSSEHQVATKASQQQSQLPHCLLLAAPEPRP